MKTKIILLVTGLLLLTGFFGTSKQALSERNVAIYEKTLSLEDTIDTGFSGYVFSAVPVRFFAGDADYVRKGDTFVKQKPLFQVLAATALLHEGNYTLIVPTVEMMEGVFSLLSPPDTQYTDTLHAAVLWHEGFHAYQLENYENQVTALPGCGAEDSAFQPADANEAARALFMDGLKALHQAVNEEDPQKIRTYVKTFVQLAEERDALLPEETQAAERFKETVEGTAYFVEMRATEAMGEDISAYTDLPAFYTNGPGKYYNSGRMMWMILNKLDPVRMESYDFSLPLRTIMEEIAKE